MQPRILALIITITPLLVYNGVYLLSASEGFVPWCIPYIDGCTTISQAARSGNALFIFRGVMIAYAVLLIFFWVYAKHWLDLLYGHSTKIAGVILWLGTIAAIFLIIYVDYLGTSGEFNRFMRRYGIMVFFTFTPLAQLLMLRQHYDILSSHPDHSIKAIVLHYQLIIILLIFIIGIISAALDILQIKTYESENIVEWNFSLLLNMYFAGTIVIWKDYRYHLLNNASKDEGDK